MYELFRSSRPGTHADKASCADCFTTHALRPYYQNRANVMGFVVVAASHRSMSRKTIRFLQLHIISIFNMISTVSNYGGQSSLREGISGHNLSAMYKTLKCICCFLKLHAKEGLSDFEDCTGLCHINILIVVISRIDSELCYDFKKTQIGLTKKQTRL